MRNLYYTRTELTSQKKPKNPYVCEREVYIMTYSPTVIDLFSGSGGFSVGFKRAGYDILLASDYDENSSQTYQLNHPQTTFIKSDITDVKPEEIRDKINSTPDVIIGGPPCQGFSIAGKRNESDERNELFKEFVKHISIIEPSIFVMENVPGLLSMETPDGTPVIKSIQSHFEFIGYDSEYKILNASNFGVPQNRKRVFIIGVKKSEQESPISFPKPNSESVVTVKDAFSDLPRLHAGESKSYYPKVPQNQFQWIMRKNSREVLNHSSVNHRDHIVQRFKHIPQGGNMTDAPKEHQPNKIYQSRNRRLSEEKSSYTVTSHVLDELIHPWDNRSITVREAARLQSFPDNYEFTGKRNVFHGSEETSQYEQVGNAVPPLLSQSIATHIKQNLI